MAKIISYEYIGEQDSYDLEVDHPDHQFYLSNGLLSSNSHAISYALISYMCAWLLTYHEKEYLCAYAECAIANPESREKAMTEIKSFGYSIEKIDINISGRDWIPGEDKRFFPSFKTCKGIGDAAITEILANRPYKSIEDLLWKEDGSWKHSKFNKRSLEHLIKIEAFDSMGIVGQNRLFKNYKHMHDVIIENYDLLKKKKGRDLFKELAKHKSDTEDWSNVEKASFYKELIGNVNIDFYIPAKLQEALKENNIIPIDDLSENKKKQTVWFIISSFDWKLTKNKKEYLLLNVFSTSSKNKKVFMWGAKKDMIIDIGIPYAANVDKTDFGYSAFKITRI